MKKIAAVSALIALLIAPAQPRAAAATPIELDFILSLTGPGAFIGSTEAKALGVLETSVNKQGGVAGQPVKFNISDDHSNPQVAIQLANLLIAKHVAVILGPSLTTGCNAVAPLVEKNGPVDYCFSPGMHAGPGSFVFSSGAGTDASANGELRFFRELGLTRFAILALTDASGQDHDEQVAAALRLPENKNMRLVIDEHFNPGDVSITAQMARIKAAAPQALITTATGTAFVTALRGVHDSGIEVPTTASAGNMVVAQMAQYKAFVPKDLYFLATHGVAPDPSLTRGPAKDAQTAYFSALDAGGVQPSYLASLAWDPTLIVVSALRRLGTQANADRLHAYLEGLRGWTGINGTYDYRSHSQRGLGDNALVNYRWESEGARFVVVPSKAAMNSR